MRVVELLDRVGDVDPLDVVVAARDAQAVGLEQDRGVGRAGRRLEAVRGELDQQPERVGEVDRVHEAAVLDAAVLDAALVEPLDRLGERRLRDRERQVVHAARVHRRAAGSPSRSSFVKTVIRRPSPGSKYRWLSSALSRFGCSNTNGIPSRPSQKSIDVWRPAPVSVMWWTPCDWILRMPRACQDVPYADSGPSV